MSKKIVIVFLLALLMIVPQLPAALASGRDTFTSPKASDDTKAVTEPIVDGGVVGDVVPVGVAPDTAREAALSQRDPGMALLSTRTLDPGRSAGIPGSSPGAREARLDAFSRDGSGRGSGIDTNDTVYAIITPPGFLSICEPLRDWKTEKGVPANIFLTTTITSTYSGWDDAEKIHNFLMELDSQAPLTWVLLVGDTEQIPTRDLYCRGEDFGLSEFYAGDYYYSGLDSNWDSNGNHYYGEIRSTEIEGDFAPNVYVGRLPVGNTTEATRAVRNILMYERTLPSGSWNSKAEFWGTLMDAPNDATVYDSWEDNAKKILDEVEAIFPDSMTVAKRYDYNKLAGGSYNLGQDQLDRFVARTKFDEGCSIVNFAGQAYYNGDTLAEYHSNTGLEGAEDSICWYQLFTHDDAYGSHNGDKLPFFFAAACDVVNISETDDTNQQRMLYAPDGGAIGLVGSVGESYRGETQDRSEGNWWLEDRFFENFFNSSYNNIYTHQGACLGATMRQYDLELLNVANLREAILANMYGFLLLGDPEVDIYTASPGSLVVSHDQIYTGSRNVTFNVKSAGGTPQLYALVCVRNDAEYEYGWTDGSGNVRLHLDVDTLDNLSITATSHNFYPVEVNATVLTAPADLQTWDALLSLEPSAPKLGDTITLNATVVNGGHLAASGCTGIFYEGDPANGGTMIGSVFSLGSMAGESLRYIETTWAPTGGWKDVYVAFMSSDDFDNTNNNASLSVYIEPPEFEISPTDIAFSKEWGVLEENITVTARVHNTGLAPASNVKLEAFNGNRSLSGWPLVTMTNISVDAGSYTDVNFEFSVNRSENSIFIYLNWDHGIFEVSYFNNKAFKILYANSEPLITNITGLNMNEDQDGDDILDLASHVSDPDNDTGELTLWIDATGPNAVSLDGGGMLDIVLVSNWFGSFSVTLHVSDGISTVDREFAVIVAPVNDPPVINFSSTVSVIENIPASLRVMAFDVEGDALTYSDNTDIFDVDTTSGWINFTPTGEQVGTHILKLTVTDAGGASASFSFTLEVQGENDPPTVAPVPDVELKVGMHWTYTLDVADPDSSSFTYIDNTDLFDVSAGGVILFTASENDLGTHSVTVWVSDGEDTTPVSFWINVTDGGGDGTGSNENTTGKLDRTIVVLLCALAVLVIAGVVVFLMLRRRKGEDGDSCDDDDGRDDDGYDDDGYDDDGYDDDGYDDDGHDDDGRDDDGYDDDGYDDDGYDDDGYDDDGYDDDGYDDVFGSERVGGEDGPLGDGPEEESLFHEDVNEVVLDVDVDEPKVWSPEEEKAPKRSHGKGRRGKGRKKGLTGKRGNSSGRKRKPKGDEWL